MGGKKILEDALNQALGSKCPWKQGHQGQRATRLGNLYDSSVGESAISGENTNSNFPRRIPEKGLIENRETSIGHQEGTGAMTPTFIPELDVLHVCDASAG